MKLFISHSWKNKTLAQKIADSLMEAGGNVWLDAKDLLPGKEIQSTIDAVLENIDIVIILWTKESAASDGVAQEIYTSSKLKKMIIPCELDGTSFVKHPLLHRYKGISFKDYNDGLARLKMVLLYYMTERLNWNKDERIQSMNELIGTLESANHLAQNENIKLNGTKEEKYFWIKKISSQTEIAHQKLTSLKEDLSKKMNYLSTLMSRIQASMSDKKGLENILKELEKRSDYNDSTIQVFVKQIKSLQAKITDKPKDEMMANYKKAINEKLKTSKELFQSTYGWLGAAVLETVLNDIKYFFTSSIDHLLLITGAKDSNPIVSDCENELRSYLMIPSGGVIDNNSYGILGYADDAYFIHSILTQLQIAQLIPQKSTIDWEAINRAAEYIFTVTGSEVKTILDNNMTQLMHALLKKHNPQAVAQMQRAEQESMDQRWQDVEQTRSDLHTAKMMSIVSGGF